MDRTQLDFVGLVHFLSDSLKILSDYKILQSIRRFLESIGVRRTPSDFIGRCFSGRLINYIFLRFNFSSRRFSPILFRTRATGYKVFVKCENIEVNFRMMNDP